MTSEQMLAMCQEQETRFQFERFSHDDVWRLGCILHDLSIQCYKPVGVEIVVNGLLLFRFYPEGANEYYRRVLTRKHNTVRVMEKSSLRFYAENQISGLDPAKDMLLNPNELQFRGGSFPIRLKNGCVIGSIAAAGMQHTEDHDLIIRALTQFFSECGA